MAAREPFAKMAAALDSNRKIRRGGRNAREVYLWVLRQVAQRDSDGEMPLADVTDHAHVADQLMCSESEAREGFERAVTVALLAVTDDRCSVVGWNEEWGRRAMTGAERVAKYRAQHGKGEQDTSENVTKRYGVTNTVTRNAGEKRRGEEKRRRDRVTAVQAAEPLRLESPQPDAKKPARAPRQVKHPLPDDWTPDADLSALAASLGIDLADQVDRMRSWAKSEGARKLDWKETARNWIKRSADGRPRGAQPSSGRNAPVQAPTFRTLTDEELS